MSTSNPTGERFVPGNLDSPGNPLDRRDAAKSEAPPSANGFSPEPAAPLPKGRFAGSPPGMDEFYQKLVERGFAPPLPGGAERR